MRIDGEECVSSHGKTSVFGRLLVVAFLRVSLLTTMEEGQGVRDEHAFRGTGKADLMNGDCPSGVECMIDGDSILSRLQ